MLSIGRETNYREDDSLNLFPNLRFVQSNWKRRTLLVLTFPLVLVETYYNATRGHFIGFGWMWNNYVKRAD